MYFNCNGTTRIVKKEVIDKYLSIKRSGNIIYCLQENDNYYAKNIKYKNIEELNLAIADYSLKGYTVHYHANNSTDKARSNKGKR